MREGKRWRWWIVSSGIFLIGIAIGLFLSGHLQVERPTIAPAVRQSQGSIPITRGQALHNTMDDFLIAEGHILLFAQNIQDHTNEVGYKLSQEYQNDRDQLSSHLTLRSQVIADYNKQAREMSTQDWKGICLPHAIADTPLDTRDLSTMMKQVRAEEKALDAKVEGGGIPCD